MNVMPARMYVHHMQVCRIIKSASDLLELELWVGVNRHARNQRPLQEQQELWPTEPSLQPLNYHFLHKRCSQCKWQAYNQHSPMGSTPACSPGDMWYRLHSGHLARASVTPLIFLVCDSGEGTTPKRSTPLPYPAHVKETPKCVFLSLSSSVATPRSWNDSSTSAGVCRMTACPAQPYPPKFQVWTFSFGVCLPGFLRQGLSP